MRRKLKYILPLVQITVAVALIFLGSGQDVSLQDRIHERCGICEVAFTAPAWHVCDGISGPLRPLWNGWLLRDKLALRGYAWSWIVPLALIALLWYWAGLNISSWIVRKQLVLPSKRFLRLPCDVLLVLIGLLCANYFIYGSAECGVVKLIYHWHKCWHGWFDELTLLEGAMDLAATTFYFVWAVVLIGFFGRDFVKSCVPRANK
jgi:hypothetical protein